MVRPEFNAVLNTVRPNRIRFRTVQNLRVLSLVFIALVFLACATLPEPEMKTITYSYEPTRIAACPLLPVI